MYACVRACLRTCMRVCMRARVRACLCVCVRVCVCACACTLSNRPTQTAEKGLTFSFLTTPNVQVERFKF